MNIKTLLTIVAIILINISFAQDSNRYYKLTEKAKNFYEKQKYLKSGQKYSEAFIISVNDPASFIDRYYASKSWVRANEIDSAFAQLFIVGAKKFQYDIWGDTVNTASRMENSGEVGKVNISQSTYELIKNDAAFTFESRGNTEVKGKGEMEMWFVEKVDVKN